MNSTGYGHYIFHLGLDPFFNKKYDLKNLLAKVEKILIFFTA